MNNYVKYPKTLHLPWSEGVNDDDKVQHDLSWLDGEEIIVLEKMDGENCLSGETLISTENGTFTIKDICDLDYNFQVFSLNEITGEIELKPIVNKTVLSAKDEDEWYEIICENSENLILTGEHYVFLPKLNCYRKVKDLTEHDFLLKK